MNALIQHSQNGENLPAAHQGIAVFPVLFILIQSFKKTQLND